MAAPSPSTVIIECPHCGTRYQVPAETIGTHGRKVSCAHCGKAWQAEAHAETPLPALPALRSEDNEDALFDAAAEQELDRAFADEERAVAGLPPIPDETPPIIDEEAVAAIAPKQRPPREEIDRNILRKRELAFSERQQHLNRQLPMARVRRVVRIVAVLALIGLIAGGLLFREAVVRTFPSLAGAYEAIGLVVNVVGIEFRDVTTLVARQSGIDRMQVDARIYSVAPATVAVPPVLVTLLGDDGNPIYEWTVSPNVASLKPGEIADFQTRLNNPPAGASRVRLTFTHYRTKTEAPAATEMAAAPEAVAEDATSPVAHEEEH